jgi:hypothetical protein
MRVITARPSAKLLLSTGDSVEVVGTPDEVGKLLQDAVRSSSGTLAWLQTADGEDGIGVNPSQVVMVTRAD